MTIDIRDGGGDVVRTLESDVPHDAGWASFSWDGTSDAGQVLPDAVYDYAIEAETVAGDRAAASGRIGIDTAPVATLVEPAVGARVTGTVTVRVVPASGRTLTQADFYRCDGWWCHIGSGIAPDLDGSFAVSWDTRDAPVGEHGLHAEVGYIDALGASHTVRTPTLSPVHVERPAEIGELSVDRYFSPDGDGQEDERQVSFTLTAPALVSVEVRDEQGALVRQVMSDVSLSEGGNAFMWDGRDADGAVVPDGVYDYTIRAQGPVGPEAEASARLGVDTRPVASITRPTPGAEVSGEVSLVVSPAAGRALTDADFYRCAGLCHVGSAWAPDVDGSLSVTWDSNGAPAGDTALLATVYYLDDFGERHSYTTPSVFVVVSRPAEIRDVSADRYFSPDGDGQEDEGWVSYQLTAPARVTVVVRDGSGQEVRRLKDGEEASEGGTSFVWDGLDEAGERVADGVYHYTITAATEHGDPAEASGRLGVDTRPVASITRPTPGAEVSGEVSLVVSPAAGRALTDADFYRCAGLCHVGSAWAPDVDGSLSVLWDTSGASTGGTVVWADVVYVDEFGEQHSYATPEVPVVVTRPAEIRDVSADRYFSPDGDGQEDEGWVSYQLTAPARVTVVVRDGSGQEVRRLKDGEEASEGGTSFVWDGLDEAGERVADGVYHYTITAATEHGDPAEASGRLGVDTRPVASITRPGPGERLSGTVRVVVAPAAGRTITSADFDYCADWWCGIGSTSTTDFDGSLGIDWDTRSVPVGEYQLVASVEWSDAFGQQHFTRTPGSPVEVTRSVGIRSLSADRYFTPNGDGQEDEADVSFRLTTPATVSIDIRAEDGTVLRTVETDAARPEGGNRFTWDGKNDGGQSLPAGVYRYRIHAQGAEGDPAEAAGRIGVDPVAPGHVLRPSADDTLTGAVPYSFVPSVGSQPLSVHACVQSVCSVVSSAATDDAWRTTLDLRQLASGSAELTSDVDWRDGFGARHTTRLRTPVTVDNTAPALELDVEPDSGETPLETVATVRTSQSDGAALDYTLDFGDGTPAETGTVASPYQPVEVQHTYTTPGTYRLRVSVNDGAGHFAQRSRYIQVKAGPNQRPTATLDMSPTSGPAPLDTQAEIAGTDPEGQPLSYTIDWADGSVDRGQLPAGPVTHRYTRTGAYLVRLAVSDGTLDRVLTRRVIVASPEPLRADAGDDVVVTRGEPVHLDGSGSRPPELIDAYTWQLGDGTTATGRTVDHAYGQAGTYTAELTVALGAERASDEVRVTVLEPPSAPGLVAHVRSSGGALQGADVVVIDSNGHRYSALTGASGDASLHGLPDGDYTVYAWRDGYRPASGMGQVRDGRGEVTIELDQGDVVATKTTSRRLSLEEIEDLGIDPNDPANQHIYEFEVHLGFSEDPEPAIRLRGHTRPGAGGGGGGGGIGFGWQCWRAGDWNPCGTACEASPCGVPIEGGHATVSVHYEGNVPTLQWLIIPGRATFLKEFFDITMVVQNLAGPGITLENGSASLTLEPGLSLAPTAVPQTLTQDLEDIPSGESRAASWVVRGDEEGEYRPATDYSATIEPFGRSVLFRGEVAEPLKVWGGSALEMIVQPEARVDGPGKNLGSAGSRPFRVRIGLHNVSDTEVYNPTVELLREGRLNYIEQPRERMVQGAAEIRPGATFWADYVLVPKIKGRLELDYSFVKKTAGDVDLESRIEPVAQKPVAWIDARASKDSVILDFQGIQGADGYEVYAASPTLNRDFADQPLPVDWLGDTKARVAGVSPDDPPLLYAVSTVENGIHTMHHPAVVAKSTDEWPSPTTSIGYDYSCGQTTTDLRFTFDDPDYELGRFYIKVGNQAIANPVPASRTFTLRGVEIPTEGVRVEAWATNTEQDAANQGKEEADLEHGPPLVKNLRPCRYAAIGDSYSSGEGAPPFDLFGNPGYEDGTDTSNDAPERNHCHRSSVAYPRIVGASLREAPSRSNWVDMTFRACSGAVIADLFTKNQGDPPYMFQGEPEGPQLKSIDPGVQILTVSIGGNDLFFADIVKNCIADAWQEAGIPVEGRVDEDPTVEAQLLEPCRPNWDAKVARKLQDLRDELPTVYANLRSQIADNGRVIVVPYPTIFPSVPESCWLMPPSDVEWLYSAQAEANEVIDEAARMAGVEIADLGNRFEGRDACRPKRVRWINGPNWLTQPEHSFHPDREGHVAMAEAVREQIARGPGGTPYHIEQGQRLAQRVTVRDGAEDLVFSTDWDGSDVVMTAISPSGRRFERGARDADATRFVGSTWESLTVEHPEPGEWTVELHGADIPPGGEDVRFATSTVIEENHAPSAVFTTSQSQGPPPSLAVTLDASDSFDIDGDVHEYRWDLGDGAEATGAVVHHTYEGAGAYRPKLTVVDNEGRENSYDGHLILVTRPPAARDDAFATDAGSRLEVDAPGLLENDTDPDGDPISVVTAGSAQHGTLEVSPDGALTYEPQADFTGVERISYLTIDQHGAHSEPAEIAITVRPPPDSTDPQTTIDSGPSGPTSDTRPTFRFSSSEEGSTFACRVDDGNFGSCASPHTTTELDDGDHRFAVRATDKAGNADESPAVRTFTVDTDPPETTITAGPDGLTTERRPRFEYSADEPGVTFACRMDGGDFSLCGAGYTAADLGGGEHVFEVRATDQAGNTDPSEASRSFTVGDGGAGTGIPEVDLPGFVGARSAGTVRVARNGKVRLPTRVDCGGRGPDCRVTVVVHGNLPKASAVKRLKIGGSSLSVTAGRAQDVVTRLSRKGRRLLARRRRIRADVKITVTRGGRTAAKTVRAALKAPKPRRRTSRP